MAQSIVVDLRISADEWLRLYRGEALNVAARARDGRSVRFPARILRPFVSHDGIHGSFVIEFGQDGKFSRVERLG